MKSDRWQYVHSLMAAFIVSILSSFVPANAQSCLADGIIFSSQTQIDAFPTDYPECTEILGGVIIKESISGDIINLNGLSEVTTFGSFLEISSNVALKVLTGLQSVSTIKGRLNISANRSLASLEGLNTLAIIGESLRISENNVLVNISALNNINSINGNLTLEVNQLLDNLSGLKNITSIAGYLIFNENNSLVNLAGLNALTSIGNNLQIENNASLESLNGLESVKSIGGDLIVDNNPTLTTLQGLNSVSIVSGFLQVVNNPSITTLMGLNSIRTVKGLVQVYNNDNLVSLFGIDSINHESIIDLAILSCPKLSNCSIQSVCDHLGIASNLASIAGNESRCNSREIILENCTAIGGNNEPSSLNKIIFFPNPTSGIVNVKGIGVENAAIKVTDSLGRLVLKKKLEERTIDLSNLASGLYFIGLTTDRKNIVESVYKVEY